MESVILSEGGVFAAAVEGPALSLPLPVLFYPAQPLVILSAAKDPRILLLPLLLLVLSTPPRNRHLDRRRRICRRSGETPAFFFCICLYSSLSHPHQSPYSF